MNTEQQIIKEGIEIILSARLAFIL